MKKEDGRMFLEGENLSTDPSPPPAPSAAIKLQTTHSLPATGMVAWRSLARKGGVVGI